MKTLNEIRDDLCQQYCAELSSHSHNIGVAQAFKAGFDEAVKQLYEQIAGLEEQLTDVDLIDKDGWP